MLELIQMPSTKAASLPSIEQSAAGVSPPSRHSWIVMPIRDRETAPARPHYILQCSTPGAAEPDGLRVVTRRSKLSGCSSHTAHVSMIGTSEGERYPRSVIRDFFRFELVLATRISKRNKSRRATELSNFALRSCHPEPPEAHSREAAEMPQDGEGSQDCRIFIE